MHNIVRINKGGPVAYLQLGQNLVFIMIMNQTNSVLFIIVRTNSFIVVHSHYEPNGIQFVHNQKENGHHNHILFNLQVILNIIPCSERILCKPAIRIIRFIEN